MQDVSRMCLRLSLGHHIQLKVCCSSRISDSVGDRVLAAGIDVPAGVTAETCTATCQTAGFSVAGLENAQECCKYHS